MEKLNDWLNERQQVKADLDMMIYGQGYIFRKDRKWYNPMRYILGVVKEKRIRPGRILICTYIRKLEKK